MQRIVVESSILGSAGHDAQSAALELQFRNGAVYQYFLVPPTVYHDLLGARSKGGFFNHNIGGRSPYQRIQDATSATRP